MRRIHDPVFRRYSRTHISNRSELSEDDIAKARLFAFNFLLFAGFAFAAPFFVLYLQSIGFTGAEIGILTGVAPLVGFCGAPLWTGLADTTRRHRAILTMALAVQTAAYILLPFLRTFLAVLAVYLLLNFFASPVSAFADSATLFILGKDRDFYGRIRVGGTIGFAAAAPLAGLLIGRFGLQAGFWIGAGMFFLGLIASRGFVHGERRESPPAPGGIRLLLSDPRWILFLAVALVSGMALSGTQNYFLAYLEELGATPSFMGIALAIGAVTEIPVLFFGHRLLRLFKPLGLFTLAMVLTVARQLLFAAASRPELALAVQAFNGLTFPMMWIAGVAYADERAPAGRRATAQGMFGAATFGIGMAAGGFLGGPLLVSLGGRGLFFVYGCLTLAVVVAAALIGRRLPPEPQRTEIPV